MTREASYPIGTLVTVTVNFTNAAGQPADPTGITFLERDPAGAVVTRNETNATNPAVGTWVWPASRAFDIPGTWRWRAEATAGLVTATEISAKVDPTLFG